MKEKLLIIGAGGHGKVVADIALRLNRWKSIYFLDDDESKKSLMGIKVIGKTVDVYRYTNDHDIFIGIGNNEKRAEIQAKLEANGVSLPVLIHPNTVIGKDVQFGEGTIVMAGVLINCCSVIGKGCIINTGSIIDHDNAIDDYVHISPGVRLAGMVRVGERSWLGIGSIVINNKCITSNCIIGAGAVVVQDIKEPGTYTGVPAKKIN